MAVATVEVKVVAKVVGVMVEVLEVVEMAVAAKEQAIVVAVKAAEAMAVKAREAVVELRVEVALETSRFHLHMRSNLLLVRHQTTCMSRSAGDMQRRTRRSRSRLPSRFHPF